MTSNEINFDRIINETDWVPFVVDTETSGYPGLPSFHHKHKLIQLAGFSILDRSVFNKYVKYPSPFKLLKQSTKIHNISPQTLENQGESLESVINDFFTWINNVCVQFSSSRPKKPLLIAHSAHFDRNMIYKCIHWDIGKDGINLDLNWICSLELARKFYPELKDNAFKPEYNNSLCKSQPYCLASLGKAFYGVVDGNFHDAVFDCKCLAKIFIERLLPHIWKDMKSEHWTQTFGMIIPIPSIKEPHNQLLLKPLKDIKYLRYTTKSYIITLLNSYFQSHTHPAASRYICNEYTATVSHLFMFGWLEFINYLNKTKMETITNDGNQQTKIEVKEQPGAWYHIISNVEVFLRKAGIYSDDIICEILACMTNRRPWELYCKTKTETGEKSLFPSLPGEPISYLPFNFDEDTSKRLFLIFGIKTAHELYIDFTEKECEIKAWVNKINGSLNITSKFAFNEQICAGNFKLIAPTYQ